MGKFEYKIKVCNGDALSLYELLDKMVERGFEVVSHCAIIGGYSIIFKREQKDA